MLDLKHLFLYLQCPQLASSSFLLLSLKNGEGDIHNQKPKVTGFFLCVDSVTARMNIGDSIFRRMEQVNYFLKVTNRFDCIFFGHGLNEMIFVASNICYNILILIEPTVRFKTANNITAQLTGEINTVN